ncbi:hypothetical protein DXG03_004010 [Asterophora parasitica]|uniref:Uncharacterized protein n=1 Tax=Asterophora parasitica TaxID=117018 RepID=A0A9P7K715_9AGAR|nr:hypothetical protein DXG03_004010 [Asterophora parasitica]
MFGGQFAHPQLPRTIFAIAGEPPTWPGADDDDMGLESISDPEEAEDEVGMDDGNVSSASHAPSSNPSHGVSTSSHFAASTRSPTRTNITTPIPPPTPLRRAVAARAARKSTPRRAPITPLPGARFDLSGAPPPPSKGKGKGTVGDAYAELEGDDGFSWKFYYVSNPIHPFPDSGPPS